MHTSNRSTKRSVTIDPFLLLTLFLTLSLIITYAVAYKTYADKKALKDTQKAYKTIDINQSDTMPEIVQIGFDIKEESLDKTYIGNIIKEEYYNLPMQRVIMKMRDMGYDEKNYPYWIREDGCKMLGKYVMVAANYNIYPKGTILTCSQGMAIVCDTGKFACTNPYTLCIAVDW